jgi:hypothetical protein
MYVRKHWYEVAMESDGTMKLYFERQPRRSQMGANSIIRFWIASDSRGPAFFKASINISPE